MVDPGFVFDDTQENSSGIDSEDQDIPKNQDDVEQDDTDQAIPDLGELDGTNPGSNHHPMDKIFKPIDMTKKTITPSTPVSPRDGLDNTGTQGYDSLNDDAYTGSSDKPETSQDEDSHTGSSSEDFEDKGKDKSF